MNRAELNNSGNSPKTREEWAAWISNKQKEALSIYRIRPEEIIANYNREQAISRDYKGREILELLQNAADAATSANIAGRVSLEITRNGLVIANTGAYFTEGGVSSLQISDLSPKDRQGQYIGCKGLGFRSILNWTRHPVILSGELAIAFHHNHSKQIVSRLISENQDVKETLGNRASWDKDMVPILPFPLDISDPLNESFYEEVGFDELNQKAKSLIDDGFDTVIVMPFDRDSAYSNAIEQIKLLRPEFLLFSRSISCMTVKMDGGYERTWSSLSNGNLISISETDEQNTLLGQVQWRLFTDRGKVEETVSDHEVEQFEYEIVIALQEDGLAEPDYLYSFFPTSIKLPVNAVCHATLELEQNRKHLQDSIINKEVLRRLSGFLAETFERENIRTGDIYRAIDLVNPAMLFDEYPQDIADVREHLIHAFSSKQILPTITSSLIDSEKAAMMPAGSSIDWLPQDLFHDILLPRSDDDTEFFENLGVDVIPAETFCERLSGQSLSVAQRAEIISGIIADNLRIGFCSKSLLLDSEGKQIHEDDTVFLPGEAIGQELKLPSWARVKLLNEELYGLLELGHARESARALSKFEVNEYSLASLISGLISSANKKLEDEDNADLVRTQLLQTIYKFYSAHKNSPPDFPRSRIKILNKKGDWVSSQELYFSDGYQLSGNIMEHLYRAIPEKLIASKDRYSSIGLKHDLAGFMSWIGVNEWPRKIKEPSPEASFTEFTKPRLEYPAFFTERDTYQFACVEELPYRCKYLSVISLDGIDEILDSDYPYILAWLINDHRLSELATVTTNNGEFVCYPDNVINPRKYRGLLPSYIDWKIKSTLWVLDQNGAGRKPTECILNDYKLKDLFPKPSLLDAQLFTDLIKASSNEALAMVESQKLALMKVGVRMSVEELTSEEIYELMLALPSVDTVGTKSKQLYNWLIKTTDFNIDADGAKYSDYLVHGKVYCKQGDDEGFYPVSSAYHVDVEGFPQQLLRTLPVAALPKKRGSEKVKKLFGVNVLDKASVNETVIDFEKANVSDTADEHFQLSKDYIEVYRHKQFISKSQGTSAFKDLKLIVCKSLNVEITFKGDVIKHQMSDWTFTIQDSVLYVKCNPNNSSELSHPLLANTIGESIAFIFGVTDGDPFSKIYQCENKYRKELIYRMLGNDIDQAMSELLDAIKDDESASEGNVHIKMGVIEGVETHDEDNPASLEVDNSNTQTPPTDDIWTVPDDVEFQSIPHQPKAPKTRVTRRISMSGANKNSSSRLQPTSDGKTGEELAMMYEEHEGRYPLYIGHITGYEVIAADVISFRTELDRDNFKSGVDQSEHLVERVIESKQKIGGDLVDLTENEFNTAQMWREKYYIYRFKPRKDEAVGFEMTILNDISNKPECLITSKQINMETSAEIQKYLISDIGDIEFKVNQS